MYGGVYLCITLCMDFLTPVDPEILEYGSDRANTLKRYALYLHRYATIDIKAPIQLDIRESMHMDAMMPIGVVLHTYGAPGERKRRVESQAICVGPRWPGFQTIQQ